MLLTLLVLVGAVLCVQLARLDLSRAEMPSHVLTPPPSLNGVPVDRDRLMDDERLLLNPIASLDLDNVPLDRALDAVRREGTVNLATWWHSIETAGIRRDHPVSVHLRDTDVERALSVILKQLPDDEGSGQIRFKSTGGVVIIAARSEPWGVVTRLYDVRDLTAAFVRPRSLSAATTQATPSTISVEWNRTPQDPIEQIVRIITEVAPADSWRENGGVLGIIREIGGVLVITQEREAHREIAALLDGLRRTGVAYRPASRPTTRSTR